MADPQPADIQIPPPPDLPPAVRLTEWVGGLAVALIFLLVIAEIVLRLLSITFGLSYDYCGFLMGICIFMTLPAVSYLNEHIQVGADRIVAFFGRSIDVLMLLYVTTLTFATVVVTYRSFHDGARSQGLTMTPIYIPQAAILLALCITTLILLIRLAKSFRRSA